MGAAQRAAIQYFHYGKHVRQPMDDLDHYGMLRTHAKGQGINTDSAAGATAMATGEKTKRNYVGVDANGKPLKTLLEIADDERKSTAIISDNDVTNATLAGFAAHHDDRDHKKVIANQYLSGTRPDLIFGGGEEVWYPEGHPGMVPDMIEDDESFGDKNLVAKAKDLGYEYAYDRESFAELEGPKALAMTRTDALLREAFIKKYNYKKDPYAVPEHEMVEKALEILEQDQQGFFMAVEVDEIDDAGHEHSPKLLFSSGQELNRIAAVLEALPARAPQHAGDRHRRPRDRRARNRGPLPGRRRRGVPGRRLRRALPARLDDAGAHRGQRPGDLDRPALAPARGRPGQHQDLRRRPRRARARRRRARPSFGPLRPRSESP